MTSGMENYQQRPTHQTRELLSGSLQVLRGGVEATHGAGVPAPAGPHRDSLRPGGHPAGPGHEELRRRRCLQNAIPPAPEACITPALNFCVGIWEGGRCRWGVRTLSPGCAQTSPKGQNYPSSALCLIALHLSQFFFGSFDKFLPKSAMPHFNWGAPPPPWTRLGRVTIPFHPYSIISFCRTLGDDQL